jgi:hypothetical protein
VAVALQDLDQVVFLEVKVQIQYSQALQQLLLRVVVEVLQMKEIAMQLVKMVVVAEVDQHSPEQTQRVILEGLETLHRQALLKEHQALQVHLAQEVQVAEEVQVALLVQLHFL